MSSYCIPIREGQQRKRVVGRNFLGLFLNALENRSIEETLNIEKFEGLLQMFIFANTFRIVSKIH